MPAEALAGRYRLAACVEVLGQSIVGLHRIITHGCSHFSAMPNPASSRQLLFRLSYDYQECSRQVYGIFTQAHTVNPRRGE